MGDEFMDTRQLLKALIISGFGTQQRFGKALGYSELDVSRIVCGRRRLRNEEKVRIAAALHVPLAVVFEEEGDAS